MNEVVWQDTIDDHTWDVRVVRTDETTGNLVLTRLADNKVILDESVALHPDADYNDEQWIIGALIWGEHVLDAIDAYVEEE